MQLAVTALSVFARKNPLGLVGLVILALVCIAALAAPWIAPYGPLELGDSPLAGPSAKHLAGTDQFGRDILSRVIFGARISLLIALVVISLGGVVATVIGMATTYVGGPVEYVWQRFVDAVMALPSLVLLLGILSVVERSILSVIVILSLRFAITNTRYIRAVTLGALASDYVTSARVIGASPARTLFRHILPNILSLIIVLLSYEVGTVILIEASLSFLGYGVPPPDPTWGSMLARDGRTYMIVAPWMLIAPAVALSLVVFAVNVVGDGVRDMLDPRLRGL
ncbi:MAG: ABC transporter permease [Dehalococcoidia bacterium]